MTTASNDESDLYSTKWQDDETMNVMMSPFRGNRSVNPSSWDRKVQFWQNSIFKDCNQRRAVHFNIILLQQRFMRKGQQPVGLPTVVDEMRKQGIIVESKEFEKALQSSWMQWCFNWLVYKPTSFALKWAFGSIEKAADNTEFIIVSLLKEYGDKLYERWKAKHLSESLHSSSKCVVSYNVLKQECCDICGDDFTLDLVLKVLQKNKLCFVSTTATGEKIVKFADDATKVVAPLTDSDISILRLKEVKLKLENEIEQLTSEMNRVRLAAKSFLRDGSKNKALSELRKKKRLDKLVGEKEATIERLDVIISNIEQVKSDKVVLDAFSTGSSVYKNLIKQYNLDVNTIDDVMADVNDTINTHDEISEAMSQPGSWSGIPEAGELEDELEALIAADLPTPPSQLPSQSLVPMLVDELAISRELTAMDINDKLPNPPTESPVEPWQALVEEFLTSESRKTDDHKSSNEPPTLAMN